MRIDFHAHYIPKEGFNMVGPDGKIYGPSVVKDPSGKEILIIEGMQLGPIASKLWNISERLEDMEKMGVEKQIISISPTSFFYYVDGKLGLRFSQMHNEAIARVVSDNPKAFSGLATVPLQDVKLAIKELERSIRELRLIGVAINSNINGKNLDEPEFFPFFEAAAELNPLIFVHPHYVVGAERMPRYFLINLVGNPLETSIAIASLIYGGILEKFPQLKFLFAHAGGAIPYIIGRLDHGYKVVPECQSAIPHSPGYYLRRAYFDTIAHFGPALSYLISTFGPERVVLGSDYPFAMGDSSPVASVQDAPGLPEGQKRQVLEETGIALLRSLKGGKDEGYGSA